MGMMFHIDPISPGLVIESMLTTRQVWSLLVTSICPLVVVAGVVVAH